ncbi:hypothetical protein VTI74DRAFT_5300 [Chaetomium olivicolor]
MTAAASPSHSRAVLSIAIFLPCLPSLCPDLCDSSVPPACSEAWFRELAIIQDPLVLQRQRHHRLPLCQARPCGAGRPAVSLVPGLEPLRLPHVVKPRKPRTRELGLDDAAIRVPFQPDLVHSSILSSIPREGAPLGLHGRDLGAGSQILISSHLNPSAALRAQPALPPAITAPQSVRHCLPQILLANWETIQAPATSLQPPQSLLPRNHLPEARSTTCDW